MGELYIHDLTPYIENFGCKTFVETGTGAGTGIEYALKYDFRRLYTIEYMTELYDEIVNDPNLQDDRLVCMNAASIEGLQDILGREPERDPILFWLDAHFPGADLGLNSYFFKEDEEWIHMPLREELKLIADHRPGKDCFIIDDLRLFEYGEYEEGNLPEYLLHMIGGYDNQFILDIFEDTHDLHRDYRHQGFLIATPKENV